MNEMVKEKYNNLDTKQITVSVDNAKFTCFIDNTFDKAHYSHSLVQLERLHFHSNYELFCVVNGPFKVRFEDGEKILQSGQTLIVPPGILHRSFMQGENVKRYNINFVMEKVNVTTDLDLYSLTKKTFAMPCIVGNSTEVEKSLQKLSQSIADDDRLSFCLYFHRLINALLYNSGKNVHFVESENKESRIYKIHHIINSHYTDDITLKEIAKTMYLSERQIRRIIYKYHGCTFSQLICKMRMKSAYELLTTTDMKILEIASFVGYDSLSGFYSAFKKEYGDLPLNVRKKY